MIKIDDTTVTELTDVNIPQGAKYLAIHQERLFAANSIDQPNGLYWTEPYDFEDWLPSLGVNYDYVGKDDGESIAGIVSYQDYVYVGKPRNIYRYSTVGDITQWSSTRVDTSHGWLYHRTIQEMDNYLFYLSPLGVVKFDGNQAIIVSEQIRDRLLGLVQLEQSARQWTQSSTNDFEAGTYGAYTVTGTATSGTTTTLVDAALTQASDFWNGAKITITSGTNAGESRFVSDFDNASSTLTFSEAFTAAIDNTSVYSLPIGSSVININNNEIKQFPQTTQDDWDSGTKVDVDTTTSEGSVILNTKSGVSYGTNIALGKTVTALNVTNKDNINDGDNTTYATLTASNSWVKIDLGQSIDITILSVGATWSIVMEYSTDDISWNSLSFSLTGGTQSYGNYVAILTEPFTARYLKITGENRIYTVTVKEAYSDTGSITTQTLDFGFTPSSLGNLVVNETINKFYNDISYQTRTSSDCVSWDSYVDLGGDGVINSDANRYLQWKATLNSYYRRMVTPVLEDGYVGAEWVSLSKDLGVAPQSWGNYGASYELNNQTVLFWMRSAATEGGLASATWHQQFPGTVISNVTLNRWIEIRCTINTSLYSEFPVVYSIQIDYSLGENLSAPCAVVWKDNYWVNVAGSGSDINNIVYKYNKDNYWLVNTNKNNNIYMIDQNYLLSGTSESDGYLRYNDMGLFEDGSVVLNGDFSVNTTSWTATDSTLASIAGGQNGNCLEITRTANIVQSASQAVTTKVNSFYNLNYYVKAGSVSGETFQLNVATDTVVNLMLNPFDMIESGWSHGWSGSPPYDFGTLTSNYALDIRGKFKATNFRAESGEQIGYTLKTYTTLDVGDGYILSMYVKGNNGNNEDIAIGYIDSFGQVIANEYTLTDEWQRIYSPVLTATVYDTFYVGKTDYDITTPTTITNDLDVLITQVQLEKAAIISDFVEVEVLHGVATDDWTKYNLTFLANESSHNIYLRKFSENAGTILFDTVNSQVAIDSWFETRNFELSDVINLFRRLIITSKSDADWLLSYSIDNGEYEDIIINYSTYTNTLKKVFCGIKRGKFIKFKVRQSLEDNSFEFHKIGLEWEPWRTLNND